MDTFREAVDVGLASSVLKRGGAHGGSSNGGRGHRRGGGGGGSGGGRRGQIIQFDNEGEWDAFIERMNGGGFGFTEDEEMELLCQGVKPWDDDAWASVLVWPSSCFTDPLCYPGCLGCAPFALSLSSIYSVSESQTKEQIIKGRFAAYFSRFFSPNPLQKTPTGLLPSPLNFRTSNTPCITSPRAPPARSVVLPRRPLALFSPAAPTRKLSFPTRAARAFSRALTCLQTLLVLRLGQKVCSSSSALSSVARRFADVSHVGRNVIIEQSFGGPKITKG